MAAKKKEAPQLKVTPRFLASLKELLFGERLRTCDHVYHGLDSFDVARGDHLCHGIATVKRKVSFGGRYPDEWRCFCEFHSKPGDEELPHAFAFRRLKKLLDG